MVVAADAVVDRVGIGWRAELALGIMGHLEHIDVVEVMADDLFGASRKQLRAMQTLARQTSLVLHGVSLGLASAEPVEQRRLDAMARVVGALEPLFWSEHLAFVRGGGCELGHLAAPPRTAATIEGTRRNVAHAARVIGTAPLLENVATLIDPPGSTFAEAEWVARVSQETDAGLLLDLNNLYANSLNFGFDPLAFIDRVGPERVTAVHLAGGRWIQAADGRRRLLDDHRHDVPDAVYALLAELARRVAHPLSVILERDGAFPSFERLLGQLERARRALADGRQRPLARPSVVTELARAGASGGDDESLAAALEAYLARLYVDRDARRQFLADPRGETERLGFDDAAVEALTHIDRAGLELAADSVASKQHGSRHRAAAAPSVF